MIVLYKVSNILFIIMLKLFTNKQNTVIDKFELLTSIKIIYLIYIVPIITNVFLFLFYRYVINQITKCMP